MLLANLEGVDEYNIEIEYDSLKNGVSAMLRLRNEQRMLEIVVEHIASIFDEVILCVQPSDDHTYEISKKLADEYSNVYSYFYPFDSLPNGSGYKYQIDNSLFSRTYYYNWCLSKCTHKNVYKWDGDMVPCVEFSKTLKEGFAQNQFQYEKGIDLALDGTYTTKSVYTGCEVRLFKKMPGIRYVNGDACEKLGVSFNLFGAAARLYWQLKKSVIENPTYLHFKWCKKRSLAQQAWPENWNEIDHFRQIIKRSEFVKRTQTFSEIVENKISNVIGALNND